MFNNHLRFYFLLLHLAVSRPIREKQCDRCQQLAPVLYRIQHDDSGQWIFVCPDCWAIVSQNNPFYVYGGTWKAKKKH